MEDKKITVVMSAYNHGKYVGRTIESVLNQTYQGFKFLVADDASQDDTVDVIMRYEDKIDEVHLFNINSGGGRVGELLTSADTPYTALINSDDYWEREKLEKQLAYMEAHPDCAACFTWCNIRDEEGNITDKQDFTVQNRTREEWMYQFVMYGNCLAHPSILIKTDIYRHLLCDMNLAQMRQTGDFYIWVKLVQQHDIHIIEEPLTNFVEHSSELSTNVSASNFENYVRASEEMSHIFHREMKTMDDDFFRRAFQSVMRNPNASTHEEIMCEKFFAMLSSTYDGVKNAAINYYYDVFSDNSLYRVMVEKYGYTNKDFYKTNVSEGLAGALICNCNAYEEVLNKLENNQNDKADEENRLSEELRTLETYSSFCGKLLGGNVQISDEIWNEFLGISADVAKLLNRKTRGNSFYRQYSEIVSDENRKADRKMDIDGCRNICDGYIRIYRDVLNNIALL
jgi:glycosyltransferase involved in cell wall biosynthesis